MRDISVSDIHKKCIEGFHSQMQIYYDNGKRLRKKTSSAPTGLVWDTNMAAFSLFLDINMADVTSYQSYHKRLSLTVWIAVNSFTIFGFLFCYW